MTKPVLENPESIVALAHELTNKFALVEEPDNELSVARPKAKLYDQFYNTEG